MTFAEAIGAGMTVMDTMAPCNFTIDGRTGAFVGVVNMHANKKKLGVGGYMQDADAILVVQKGQFGTTPPRDSVRITADGRRYVIDSVEEDTSSYTLILMGVNQ